MKKKKKKKRQKQERDALKQLADTTTAAVAAAADQAFHPHRYSHPSDKKDHDDKDGGENELIITKTCPFDIQIILKL